MVARLIIIVALSGIWLAVPAYADELVDWPEEYGPRGFEVEPAADRDYQWLYEILFPYELRQQFPNESFKSFRVHLRDSDDRFPAPESIRRDGLGERGEISGFITYVGIFPKSYRYRVERLADGSRQLSVRVHFKNATPNDLSDLREKFAGAEELWNRHRPAFDFPYLFRFYIVDDERLAHFSVELLDSTRGPYDQYWSRRWNQFVVAHELGHMLGLSDEYKTISGEMDCLKTSLMCASWSGELMAHHYYFVLRRLVDSD